MFERFTQQAHRILDLAREEAEGLGHRYLGPGHLLLGILREGASGAARLLWSHGVGLEAARDGLLILARRGVVPVPRPTDRALLGTLGIDLEAVRRSTEQAVGGRALAVATWRRSWRGARVVWTPLCGPPLLAKRALQLASLLGHRPRARVRVTSRKVGRSLGGSAGLTWRVTVRCSVVRVSSGRRRLGDPAMRREQVGNASGAAGRAGDRQVASCWRCPSSRGRVQVEAVPPSAVSATPQNGCERSPRRLVMTGS
jgi:Clp amino terminal domain, pathogenicity island component